MPYKEKIIANLPDMTPPGMQVTIRKVGDKRVQFRVERSGKRSFLYSTEMPSIYTYPSNAKLIMQHFSDIACLYDQQKLRQRLYPS